MPIETSNGEKKWMVRRRDFDARLVEVARARGAAFRLLSEPLAWQDRVLQGYKMSFVLPWNEIEMSVRLVLAALLGAGVGYEREHADKPAGLRTHTLVSLGAALFTVVSLYGFGSMGDPSRVAAQIVTGIGFLGAGAILRNEATVKGLTTAASIWTTAAIGMAVGVGMYAMSVVTMLIVLVILRLMRTRK